MSQTYSIIQFPHPGAEQTKKYIGSWSTKSRPHTRKFLVQQGKYLDASNAIHSHELVFWAEWEPQTELVHQLHESVSSPNYILRPFYSYPKNGSDLHNTDPFVFGNQFLYSNCRQKKDGQLQKLTPGSLILFGSHKDDHFVLDTVFVVAKSIQYNTTQIETLKNKVPKAFFDVTLKQLKTDCCSDTKNNCVKVTDYVLYFGATFEAPVGGMYSYIPCLTYSGLDSSFQRPPILIEGIISNNLAQNFKLTKEISLEAVHEVWETVMKQLFDQGLQIGIEVNLPTQR